MAYRDDRKPYNRSDNSNKDKGSDSGRGTSSYRYGGSGQKEDGSARKMTPQQDSSRKMTPQQDSSSKKMTPQQDSARKMTPQHDGARKMTPQQEKKKDEAPPKSGTPASRGMAETPTKDSQVDTGLKNEPGDDPYAKTTNNTPTGGNNPETPSQEMFSLEAEDAANDVIVCGLPPGARHGEKKFNGRCRLFVGNLERGTEEEELRQLFSRFGETGEVFVNKDKGFGFIRLDYRLNAERAKLTLDKKLVKGRPLQVRYALHASAIELHGLNQFASNQFIEEAMSQFGQVERACIVCDDRGRSKGYAIVEFAWKKSAQKVLDRFKDELFVLGRLPKPIYAKQFTQSDEEEGIHEEDLQRINGYANEREFYPRFISPSSLEFEWAKKWRDVFIEEEEKKARLDEELRDSRYRLAADMERTLEIEMENAMHEREAIKMREDLMRRQEELRMFEEEMARRRDAASRDRERAMHEKHERNMRNMPPPQQGNQESHMRNSMSEISGDQQYLMKHDLELKQEELLRAAGFGDQFDQLGAAQGLVHQGLQMGLAGLPPADLQGLSDIQMHTQMGLAPHEQSSMGQGRDEQRFEKRPRRN